MQGFPIVFTAPSSCFEGATISITCTRYLDGDWFETEWSMDVVAADGSWLKRASYDDVQHSLDAMIIMLAPFYDGTSLWTLEGTDQQFTFWQMVVRTLPANLI